MPHVIWLVMTDDKKTLKFQMMMSPGEAEALDEWMFSNRLRSRAEAIRRLTQSGLALSDRVTAMMKFYSDAVAEATAITAEQIITLARESADQNADPLTRLDHLKAYVEHTFRIEELVLQLCREILIANHGNELAADTAQDVDTAIADLAELRKRVASAYPAGKKVGDAQPERTKRKDSSR